MTALARRALVPLFYGVASGFALLSFLAHWGAALSLQLDTALRFAMPRPYVYRVLSPLVVRAVVASVPGAWEPALIAGWAHGVPGLRAFAWCCRTQPSLTFLVSVWLMFASLWGAALVWRALVRWALPERPPAIADAVPVLFLLLLPATFTGGGFLYDLPELFLVSACFLAFVRTPSTPAPNTARRWVLWYSLLVVSILNKEASLLVVTWWLAQKRALAGRIFWTHAVLSGAVGAGTVLALWWAFRGSPGYVGQPNFVHNVEYWTSLRWALASHDEYAMGIPLPVGAHVLIVLAVILVWRVGKRHVPSVVARSFVWSMVTVAPLALLFGFENEVRVFAVAMPPFVVLGAGTVDAFYRGKS